MNSKLVNLIIFTAGAAVGSVVTWKLLKTKYEQIVQEEIDSVKEAFSRKHEDEEEPADEQKESYTEMEKPNLMEYAAQLQELKYAGEKKVEELMNDMDKPYVIKPEEFGELDDYEEISLICYEDGVLTDEFDNIIDDIDEIVGTESLSHFGEYEDDSVFVRNDRTRCDYEILMDSRKYSDIYSMED